MHIILYVLCTVIQRACFVWQIIRMVVPGPAIRHRTAWRYRQIHINCVLFTVEVYNIMKKESR
jgi:hypothetical protein